MPEPTPLPSSRGFICSWDSSSDHTPEAVRSSRCALHPNRDASVYNDRDGGAERVEEPPPEENAPATTHGRVAAATCALVEKEGGETMWLPT